MSQMVDLILLPDEIWDRNAYGLARRDQLVLFPELWESLDYPSAIIARAADLKIITSLLPQFVRPRVLNGLAQL
jgi:hypothetical protein